MLTKAENSGFYGGGIAFIGGLINQRQAALLERHFDTRQPRPTVTVILIQDADACDAQILRQVMNPGFGLLPVGATNIDDVAFKGAS